MHFVTFTVINWIDFFVRDLYREVFINSVIFCQNRKDLKVYSYCIMPSHIHMILKSSEEFPLEGVIRDIKRHTSRQFRKLLEDRMFVNESRREWLLWHFTNAGKKNGNNNDFQFWQQHNQPIELNSNKLIDQKVEYIHMNPVEASFVDRPEYWLYSSAGDYTDFRKGMIDVIYV